MSETTTVTFMPHNAQHERDQAEAFLDLALRDGCAMSVHDGSEWVLKKPTSDRAKILGALGETDNNEITWFDASGKRLGWFWLIYGNGQGELIADYTANDPCEALWNEWMRKVDPSYFEE